MYGVNGIAQQQVKVNVNLENKIEPMKPIWAWFGYDEPNYSSKFRMHLTSLSLPMVPQIQNGVHCAPRWDILSLST